MERESSGLFEELHPPLRPELAAFEASRCLECGGKVAPAPCVAACPTHIDIPKFIKQIHLQDLEGAAKTIFSANVLGGTCARVCPVEELCEGACVLKKEGRKAVTIGRLQRYATDWALDRGIRYLNPAERPLGKSVGVIGAGPAGLSCAAELAKLGYSVTVYESRPAFGGLITYAIAPYKQRYEPIPKEVEAIKRLGVEFKLNTTIDKDSIAELEERHQAIFLGIGMGEDLEVHYPGDDLEGVYESLKFVELLKQDPSKLKIGPRVAVIGGGNTAIDAAREAVRLVGGRAAATIMVLYRRTEEEMPAYHHEVERAREEGVQFYWLTNPIEFLGDRHVTKVRCIHMRLGEPDRSGRRRPEPVAGTEFTLEADTVIKAIGQRAREEFLRQIKGLELEDGLVKVDPQTHQTTNPRYFAGGDCVNGGGTVVEAVQHGKLAARGIHEYLQQGALSGRGRVKAKGG